MAFRPLLHLFLNGLLRQVSLYYTNMFRVHKRNISGGIYQEGEGGIEKLVSRITVWHQETKRVMTNSDCDGRIFLSHPHMNNELLF